ncbi:MAG: M16 family metallopeptidase [Phycisphaerales bacterium]
MSTIVTRRLSCGTPLIAERMSGVRSASLTWLLPTGCARDPAEKQGLAAMWGEIILRGAGSRSSREHADALDRLGVVRATEPRVFTLRLGATMLGERMHEALPLLSDMVLAPRMEESAVEPCRDLAMQALASVADDPQERASLAARERHHPQPLCRSGLGTEEGLEAISGDDLRQEWARHARPGGSIIAAAGAVDVDALEGRLNELFSSWQGASPEPEIGPPAARGYGHIEDPSNQVQVLLLEDAPPEPHPDSLLEKVVVMVLSGGMSGRLFTEVREKRGLCYSVSAGYGGDRDYGVLSAYVGTTPERAQESLDVLHAELRRITTPEGAITPEEFSRAVVGMKSGLIFSGESTSARAASLAADYRRLGRSRSLDELAGEIDRLSLDRVNEYLSRRKPGRVTIQTLGPAALKPPSEK